MTINNFDAFDIPIVAATESVGSDEYDAVYTACLNDTTVTTPSSPPADVRPRTGCKYSTCFQS